MRIVLPVAHLSDGRSMRRYSTILTAQLRALGHEVTVAQPPSRLSGKTASPRIHKLIVYFEKFVVNGIRTRRLAASADYVIVPDHSDAIYGLWLPGPFATVCHDLIAVKAALGEIPEHRTRWTGRIYQKFVLIGLRRSSKILSVSDATAQDVLRLTGRRSRVVYNYPDSDFADVAREAEGQRQADFIIVAPAHWRKSRVDGLRLWHFIVAEGNLAASHLHVVGSPLTGEERKFLKDHGVEEATVVIHQGVTDSEVARLYRSCVASIHPSRYEGFGWPVVESNLLGTPAVCRDIAVFREIAGPYALYFDDSFSKKDAVVLASRLLSEWDVLSECAEANATRFTYEKFQTSLAAALATLRLRLDNPRA